MLFQLQWCPPRAPLTLAALLENVKKFSGRGPTAIKVKVNAPLTDPRILKAVQFERTNCLLHVEGFYILKSLEYYIYINDMAELIGSRTNVKASLVLNI